MVTLVLKLVVPEEAVKVPKLCVKASLKVIVLFPPVKVPSAWIKSLVPTVKVMPVALGIFPV